MTESKYEIVKVNELVIVTTGGPVFFSLSNSELPEFVSNVANSIIEHGGMNSKMQVDSWDASNELAVSKYAESLIQLDGLRKISQDPSTWKCEMSGDKNSSAIRNMQIRSLHYHTSSSQLC